MQVTLDGYVEGPDADMSWMEKDNAEDWDELFTMLANVDLFLLGRVMWPDYRNYWTKALTDESFSENEKKYARLAEKTKHIIFSNTINDTGWDNASVMKGDVVKAITDIKQQPGNDIQVVGGAKLAATVIQAGLVDEYRFIINPAIIGKGKSFFMQQDSKRMLTLKQTKILKSGVIVSDYIPRA